MERDSQVKYECAKTQASSTKYIEVPNKHRKNCETALFKVWIVENVFCRKVEVVIGVVEVDEVVEVRGERIIRYSNNIQIVETE